VSEKDSEDENDEGQEAASPMNMISYSPSRRMQPAMARGSSRNLFPPLERGMSSRAPAVKSPSFKSPPPPRKFLPGLSPQSSKSVTPIVSAPDTPRRANLIAALRDTAPTSMTPPPSTPRVVSILPPVQIIAASGALVKETPILFGGFIACLIKKHAFVRPIEDRDIDGVRWIRISCGWICTFDSDGTAAYKPADEAQATAFFQADVTNRRRLASCICATLTKSYSLPNARRISKAVLRHAQTKGHNLMFSADLSIDELLNALNASTGLKRNEIFEFIKIAACLQADPVAAVVAIAEELETIISLRPTLWVTQDLNVLTTCEAEQRNNRFVISAARGDWKEFNRCVALGQELSVLHSTLHYTAIHAAAEFGTHSMISALCDRGVSINVRDSRLGQTPLHYAAAGGKYECAKLLLERGADRDIGCNRGQLPFELATEVGNVECAELLKHRPPEIVHFVVSWRSSPRLLSPFTFWPPLAFSPRAPLPPSHHLTI
jgi:hypothetical protein